MVVIDYGRFLLFIVEMFAWVWVIPVLAVGLILFGLEKDQWYCTPFGLAVAYFGYRFLAGFDVDAFFREHLNLILVGVGVYLAVGIAWGYLKMVWLITKVKYAVKEALASYDADTEHGRRSRQGMIDKSQALENDEPYSISTPNSDRLKNDLRDWEVYRANGRVTRIEETVEKAAGKRCGIPMQIKLFKGKIINWMAAWPVSMIWTLINDPVREFFTWTYHVMGRSLQRISDRAFADLT